jgi:plasmid stabilization system protein ParE
MNLRFTVRSSQQINKALSYVRERSPSGAENISRRISDAIDLLHHQPRYGRVTDRRSVRRINLSPYPYVMFYRLIGNDVVVTRFVHAARKDI